MIWDSTFVLIAHPANERVGAPYSNHLEKVSTKHDSSLPAEHKPNLPMDWNHDEGQATMRMDAILLKTEMKTLTTDSAAKPSAGGKFHWTTYAVCRLNNKSSPTVGIPDKNIVS